MQDARWKAGSLFDVILRHILDFTFASLGPYTESLGDLCKRIAATFLRTNEPEIAAVVAVPIKAMCELVE